MTYNAKMQIFDPLVGRVKWHDRKKWNHILILHTKPQWKTPGLDKHWNSPPPLPEYEHHYQQGLASAGTIFPLLNTKCASSCSSEVTEILLFYYLLDPHVNLSLSWDIGWNRANIFLKQCNLLQYQIKINLNKYLHQVVVIWCTHISHFVISPNLDNKRFGEL